MMYHAILYTPGGAAATAKRIGTIGDGHSENCEGQVRHFGDLLPFIACNASNW